MTNPGFSEEPLGEAARLVAVEGDLDIANSPELRTRVGRALADGIQKLVIDLAAVDHLDSTALAALIEAHQRTSERRGRMVLVVATDNVRRTIEMRGLDRVFTLADSREQAIAAAAETP